MPIIDARVRLLNKVQQLNKDFISTIQRSLLGADIQYVHYKMSSAEDSEELVKIGDVSVTGGIYRNLLPAQPFSSDFMRTVMSLFRNRSSRISDTHKELHEVPPTPKAPVDRSVFFASMAEAEEELLPSLTCESVVSAYVLCRDTSGAWFMFYIDLKNSMLFTLNPRFGIGDPDENTEAFTNQKVERLRPILKIKYPDKDFELQCYPHQYYQPNEDDFSSGVYIFLMLYYLEMKCPIYFRRAELEKIRNNLGYWILIEQLPC